MRDRRRVAWCGAVPRASRGTPVVRLTTGIRVFSESPSRTRPCPLRLGDDLVITQVAQLGGGFEGVFEDIVHDIVRGDILGLAFEVQDQAVPQRGMSQPLDVVF